jgi:hypothetical protein
MATVMVGAEKGPVDELLNEQPILRQAASATISAKLCCCEAA